MKPGDIISSRYRVDQVLSMRGISQRCIGERLHDHERVIIETLHDSVLNDEAAIGAFRYEVELSVRLNDPYFIGVIDSFTYDDSFFVVWKYIDAHPLTRNNSLLELSTNQIMVLIASIAKALDLAHNKGVLHGALSTDAILVTPSLEPIIIDFAVPGVELTTDPGVEGGISVYRAAAPELFKGEPIDASCDFYSLGVIGQFLLANADAQREREARQEGSKSPVQSVEPPELGRARTLVSSLTSTHREVRQDCAERILDSTFLDAMATPPQGNEIVRVNRSYAQTIKHRHKIELARNNKTEAALDTLIRVLLIAGVAIAALVVLAKLLSS